MLKSFTVTVLFPVSPFTFVNIFFKYFGGPVLCAFVNEYNILLLYWSLYHYIMPFFSFVVTLDLESTFSDISIATFTFSSFPFAWNVFFHPLSFSLCVSLALKWVCCKQPLDGSCILSNQPSYVFWLEHLK